MTKPYTFASESVCAGHPDKLCDAISDAILDAALAQDTKSRVAVEAVACANKLVLAGEITTGAAIDVVAIARDQIRRLGYTNPDWGFDDTCDIVHVMHQQSPEISVGVDNDGAGDQGMMFGFACDETESFMPLPISLAHDLTRRIDEAREQKTIDYLRPDGKAQVVVRYENNRPVSIEHVTVAVAHREDITHARVKQDIYESVVEPALEAFGYKISPKQVIVNGTGVWHIPGPYSDAGLTGRKIVVDSYGGRARVGGGAFSGKDPSKVDRSGAYAARFMAKNIVAAGLAKQCEVGLAYYIGAKEPIMINIETFNGDQNLTEIQEFAKKLLVPSVKNIIEAFDLRRPIYLPTAAYGHFGRAEFPWERIVKSELN